jgi:hypothetical protein
MIEEERLAQEASDLALQVFIKKYGNAALKSIEKHGQTTSEAASLETSVDELAMNVSLTGLNLKDGIITNPPPPPISRGIVNAKESGYISSRTATPSPTGTRREETKGSAFNAQGEAITSGIRGRTDVGPQVEHPSAYVLFEQLAYSSIEGKKVSEIPQNLANNFGSLPLKQESIERMQTLSGEAKELVPVEVRKIATRQIRGGNHILVAKDYLRELINNTRSKIDDSNQVRYLDEIDKGLNRITSEIDTHPIRQAIRLGNRANLAPVVKEIMDDCVFGANKMKYASLPTEGVPPNPNTGQEQHAKNDLLLLSDFIQDARSVVDLNASENDQLMQTLPEDLRVLDDIKTLETLQKKWNISSKAIERLLDTSTGKSFPERLDQLLQVKVDGVPKLDDMVKYMETILTKPIDGERSQSVKAKIGEILTNAEDIALFKEKWEISASDIGRLLNCSKNPELLEGVKSQLKSQKHAATDLVEEENEEQLITKILQAQFDAKETVQDKITRRMGELFYYPHLDQDKLHHYTIYEGTEHAETADWAVGKDEWDRAKSKQHYTQWSKPRNNNPEIMHELVGRHLVLTFRCFEGLSEFSVDKQEELTNGFLLSSVLDNSKLNDNQGWKDGIYPDLPVIIALSQLNDDVRLCTKVVHSNDHDTRIFYAKDSAADIETRAKQNSTQINQQIS